MRGVTSRAGPVGFARLGDNKQHHHRVITHAWLLWALIGAARREKGGENKGNGERVVEGHAGNWSFDHRVKNYQLNAHTAAEPQPQRTMGNVHIQTSTSFLPHSSDSFIVQ